MKYIPTSDNILVRLDPRETEFGDSGLARPSVAEEMPMTGTVVARGPGRWGKKGVRRVPMTITTGDRVMIPWATGQEISIGGVYHREVRESDVLATLDDAA
jgi:chaperonin GroES